MVKPILKSALKALRYSARIYFAPLIGAYRQMRFELRRVDRDIRRRRQQGT